MNLYILQQYKLINNLYRDTKSIDIMINVEDFFDIMNVYVFPNWFDCEVVDFKVMKYFTNIVLKSPYKKMPHPKGAIILSKMGCKVKYKETYDYVHREVKSPDDLIYNKENDAFEPKIDKVKVWIVDILILNKHLINNKIYDLEAAQKEVKQAENDGNDLENAITNDDAESENILNQINQ